MSDILIKPTKKLKGHIRVPSDKSISHRALMIGSMAKGTTTIENLLKADDVMSTLNCLKQLGISIEEKENNHIVQGAGKFGFKKPVNDLDVGNSGTTLRILPGILVGQDFSACLIGDESVSVRPMERVLKPLRMMGAQTVSTEGHAPVTIKGGRLNAIDYHTEVPSAQVKSAILLAGLLAEGKTVVVEDYKSRDHTEKMLQSFGADLKIEGNKVIINGDSELQSQRVVVPGDFSSAAFFIAAGILIPEGEIKLFDVGINENRTGFASVLKRMGCDILGKSEVNLIGNEKIADINVKHCSLKAVKVERAEIPSLIDELPVLAVVASQAEGQTVISGAEELRVKETDRIKTTVSELIKMGADIEERPDGFVVRGPVKLKGAQVESHGDHRLAMALSVAGLIASGETRINQADVTNISFPGFFDVLNFICTGDG